MKKQMVISFLLGGVLVLGTAGGALAGKSDQIAQELEGIVVTATRTEHTLADVPEATTVITAKELELQNATNALEALRWIPGVNMSMRYGTHSRENYKFNGISSAYTLVLVDGNRPSGRYPLSEIPVSAIERIEVVKGANSLLYGSDAMSGVINIITKKAKDTFTCTVRGIYSDSEEDSNAQEITAGFKFANLRQLYTYRRDHTQGDIYDRDIFLAKWGVDLDEEIALGFDFRFNQYEMGRVKDDRYDYHLNLDWHIDDKSSLKAKVFFKDFNEENHVGGHPIATIGDTKYNEEEIIYTRLFGESNLITAGYQHMGDDLDRVGPLEDWSKDQSSHNFFLQDEITLSESFILVPALRVDFHSAWDDQINPKLSMLWKASDTLSLRVSWGTAFKAPSLENLYSNTLHPMGRWQMVFVGNPDLQPEKSRTFRISAEKRFGNMFVGSLALFRNDYEDMIAMVHKGREEPYIKYSYENVAKAMTQGAEMELKYHMTEDITAGLGYTYLDTENKSTGKTLSNTVEHRLTPMVRYHNDNMGLTLEVRCAIYLLGNNRGAWGFLSPGLPNPIKCFRNIFFLQAFISHDNASSF